MKTSLDVIKRILWDENLPSAHFSVGYIDRFVGIIDRPFDKFDWTNFNHLDPDASAIPRHRIVYFK